MPQESATQEEYLRNVSEREQERGTNHQHKPLLTIIQVFAIITALVLAVYNNALIVATSEQEVSETAMLVETETFGPLAPCHEGGVRLYAGMDINGNGILDSSESQSSTVICHGMQGLSGPQGQPGKTGDNATLQLLNSVPIIIGDETCQQGGVLIESGLDANNNQQLDAQEVTSSATICHGSQGVAGVNGSSGTDGLAGIAGDAGHSALVDKIPAPPYLCRDGFVLRFGIDDGAGAAIADNGELEQEEVAESLNFCFEPLTSERITDLVTGSGNSLTNNCDAAMWLQAQDAFVFAANNGTGGCELYRYDLQQNTTTLVADINPLGESLPGRDLGMHTVQNGEFVVFDASDGVESRRLWVSDGTEEGTQALGEVEMQAPIPWWQGLLFVSPTGDLLWTNGTDLRDWHEHPQWNASQQQLVRDSTATYDGICAMWCYGDDYALWFSAMDGSGDLEPHRIDMDGILTSWNVNLLGSTTMSESVSDGQDVITVAVKGTVKQVLRLGANGSMAWLTSITPSLGDTYLAEGMGLHKIGGNLIFDAVESSNPRLWTTHLASGITLQLSTEILAPGAQVGVANTGGRLLFDCITPNKGTEVCITDGTPQGSRLLHDLTPGFLSSEIRGLAAIGANFVIFSDGKVAGDQVGISLWSVNGEVVEMMYNPWQGTSNSSQALTYGSLVVASSQVYFIADDGVSGHEWHRWSHGELSEDWIILSRS